MCHYAKRNGLLTPEGWLRTLLLIGFLSVGVFGCADRQVILPKVAGESGAARHEGKFVWFDLFTRDLPRACDFYNGVFGWSFENTAVGCADIKTISNNGVPVGNAVLMKPNKDRPSQSKWISFMSVPDVDVAVKRITDNGGAVHIAPKDVPDRGRLALVYDPEGAPFAVLTSLAGDPSDRPCVPNYWVGSELWTNHPKAALKFYEALAGYQPEVRKMGTVPNYLLLFRDGRPRAGVVKIPWKNVKPNWIPYIGVSNIEATVEKAQKLGGTVLVGLDPDREDDVAILADPSGAVFGIQQLPGDRKRGEGPS